MEREQLDVDVLFVGAGPANLAGAYHLAERLKAAGREAEIMVIEKAQAVGEHVLSGAIMDPRAMDELFGPSWRTECPIDAEVKDEKVYFFTATKAWRFPVVPSALKNHGNVVVSLSRVVQWMKEKVEALGVMVVEAFPGNEMLYDGDRVVGVRTMDMGLDKDGRPGPAFMPGTDIHAKVTVLGEGPRGSLAKQLGARLGLEGRNPQVYGTGIKEIWDLPAGRVAAGEVWHSAGWPLRSSEYGGSWVYGMSDTRVSIGFVAALDGGDPAFDPWYAMQRWKTHPHVAALLAGGTLVKAGAKTVPEGGYWSRPRSHGAGFLIVGDSASLLNIARLKGIHTALKSGMLAAQTVLEALEADDFSAERMRRYDELFDASWLKDELWKTRNYRASFRYGFWAGGFLSALSMAVGGRLLRDPAPLEPDWKTMKRRSQAPDVAADATVADGKLTFDKVTGVYHAGAIHEEQQPTHLIIADTGICIDRCTVEYGNPCEKFCPAAVYEIVSDPATGRRMHTNFSNCVHCKTCDVMDPYAIITWTVPTDAGGPKYLGM